jgi:YggT family protein
MIFNILYQVFKVLNLVIFVWAIMSWIPTLRESSFYKALDSIIDPILAPIRKVIPPIGGTFDISPMILLIGLQILLSLLR